MKRIILAVLLLPILSACQTMKGVGDWLGGDSAPAKPTVTCAAVLAPDQMTTSTIAKGDTPMELQATLRLKVGDIGCEKTDTGLRQTVAVTLVATKGPALKDKKLSAGFFAAVVDPDSNVTAKKLYQTTFHFDGDVKTTEDFNLVFNLTAEQAARSSIYLGFRPADEHTGEHQ